MKNIFLFLIRFYRRFVSPLFPPSCRFVPSCSEYAMEAFQRKSVHRALWLTVIRVMKCNPWHPGGYDPVK